MALNYSKNIALQVQATASTPSIFGGFCMALQENIWSYFYLENTNKFP
jgi:hypothetical protein